MRCEVGRVDNDVASWELFDATFSVKLGGVERLCFEIRGVPVQYDAKNSVLWSGKGQPPKGSKSRPVVEPQGDCLTIRAILDRCTLDLVVNGGQAHLVGEAYPDRTKPPLGLTEGAPHARLKNAKFIEMKSIWE